MKFLANMRIGRKLALSFVGLAALAVIGIGSSLRGLGQLNDRFNTIVDRRVTAVKYSARLHRNIEELRGPPAPQHRGAAHPREGHPPGVRSRPA